MIPKEVADMRDIILKAFEVIGVDESDALKAAWALYHAGYRVVAEAIVTDKD